MSWISDRMVDFISLNFICSGYNKFPEWLILSFSAVLDVLMMAWSRNEVENWFLSSIDNLIS